jgi:RNA-directed DNA polymerase
MNKRTLFCRQLSAWLINTEWHFTTLLAVCIETIDELPPDIDILINKLLLAFPQKPGKDPLVNFLQQSVRVRSWFQFTPHPPRIRRSSYSFEVNPVSVVDGLPAIDTVGDLAHWLGLTPGRLEWLADLKRYDRKTEAHLQHYHYQLVDKRDGSKRLIESPKTLLKSVQRQINSEILSQIPVHDAACGFRKGLSCQSHAARHTSKTYLFLFDLSHCFNSIHWGQVSQLFKRQGYSAPVVRYLTALCTHRSYAGHPALSVLDAEQCLLLRNRHLPQGAPSSPALSNHVMRYLDQRLDGLAKSLGLDYSRYADDLAMSGNQHRDWVFLEPLVGSICLEQGFSINYRKTRIVRSHQRQKVTGIVVNQKTNIDRRDFDRIKAILTNCVRHGLESQNHARHEDFRAHLWGSVQYVKSLNETRGKKLEDIYFRI